MSRVLISSIVLASALVCSQSAKADPVSFQLTLTTDSDAELAISATFGVYENFNPAISFESGTIAAAVDDRINQDLVNDTTGIALSSAEIELADETTRIQYGIIGGVAAGVSGVKITALSSGGSIPLTEINSTNPFEYSFDPGGLPTEITIDEGVFTYLGTGGVNAIWGSGTIDFSTNPLSSTIDPVGQIGLVTQHAVLSDGFTYVTVSAPLSFVDEIVTVVYGNEGLDSLEIRLQFEHHGSFVATGKYLIPEPSTVVLLGIALVGLIPLWRKFHDQR